VNIRIVKTGWVSNTCYVDLVMVDEENLHTFVMTKESEPNVFNAAEHLHGDHFDTTFERMQEGVA
jgi:hypothetical protein